MKRLRVPLCVLNQPENTTRKMFFGLLIESNPGHQVTVHLIIKSHHFTSGAELRTNWLQVNLSKMTVFQLGCVFSKSVHRTNHFDCCQFCIQKAFPILYRLARQYSLLSSLPFRPKVLFIQFLYCLLDDDCYIYVPLNFSQCLSRHSILTQA